MGIPTVIILPVQVVNQKKNKKKLRGGERGVNIYIYISITLYTERILKKLPEKKNSNALYLLFLLNSWKKPLKKFYSLIKKKSNHRMITRMMIIIT